MYYCYPNFEGVVNSVRADCVFVMTYQAQPWPYHAIQKVIEGEFGQSIGDM